jgi:O-antigen/teichoic acid export membrane protein
MGFSASNFLAQLGVFANGQAGVVVLGLLSGPIPVGLYRLAERVMNSVLAAAAASIQAVSLPEFSRRQDDPAQLRGSVISLVRLSCMVTLPALAGLSVVSPHLTLTMGSKWSPASPVLTVLCIVGMTQVFALFTGPLLQALNRPLQLAALEWARTLLSISTFALAGYLVRAASAGVQATGVALAQLATGALIVAPVYLFILAKLCNVGLVEIAGAVAPSATAAAVTAGVVVLLGSSGLVASQRPAAALAVEVVLGGASGILALVWLDRQVRHLVADIAHTVLGRRRCRVTSKGDRYSCKEEVR